VAQDLQAAESLNVDCTYALAKACAASGAFLVLLSTDYVFDGTSPPYAPESWPAPVQDYGRLKLRAEYATLAAHANCAILRVPVLYGPTSQLDESAVTLLHSTAQAVALASDPPSSPLRLDAWAIRTPTFTPDVARVLRRLCVLACGTMGAGVSASASAAQQQCTGIFQWSASERCTKFDQAVLMAQLIAGADGAFPTAGDFKRGLVPVWTPPGGAPRPQNCEMKVTRLISLGVHAGGNPSVDAHEGVPCSALPRGVPLAVGLQFVLQGAGVPVAPAAHAAQLHVGDSSKQ
jgi:dTDP-4-dehydrorhamnose reductase